MITHAKLQYLRISPSKVRQVINLIRGKNVVESQAILMHVTRGATKPIRKLLDSAVDNAKQKGLNEEQLFISKITADQGPVWKRFRPAAFGRATPIQKKTSHVRIELDLITK